MEGVRRAATSAALTLASMLLAVPVHAAPADDLIRLVNIYRTAPATCNGQRMPPVPALARSAVLSGIRIGPGTIIAAALEQKGYDVAHVEAISIAGPEDAQAVLDAATASYCMSLRATRFQHIGVARQNNAWDIVLAQPAPPRPPAPPPLAPILETARATLAAVNQARSRRRSCGTTDYPAVAPLTLNQELIAASEAHSRDMATQNYFAHEGKDGSRVSQRARVAGYSWSSVGENIAYGQRSVDEVMQSWLTSPGHCANIMNERYTEMGVGYALSSQTRRPYWTQVFGARQR